MSLFVVVIRHNVNDIPVRVFVDRAEAFGFAEAVTDEDINREHELCDMRAEYPICSYVYEFDDGGKLVAEHFVADMEVDGEQAVKPGELF